MVDPVILRRASDLHDGVWGRKSGEVEAVSSRKHVSNSEMLLYKKLLMSWWMDSFPVMICQDS